MLVPTRELAEQVRGQVGKLVEGLGLGEGEGEGIRVVNVAGNEGGKKKRKTTAGGERAERYATVQQCRSKKGWVTTYGQDLTQTLILQDAARRSSRDCRCDAFASISSPSLRGALSFASSLALKLTP